jgi:glycosyltransferase involved in cell wall biosynthesis
MPNTINVVEPTLTTEAGHCYSFITALCRSSDPSQQLRVWAARRAELTFSAPNVEIKKYFFSKIRRLQSFFLYKKLLNTAGKVFISTAGHTDLLLLDLASSGVIPPNKVFLYVHWFNPSERKLASLRQLARKQPHLEIYGPTATVTKVFQAAGFDRACMVPYPISSKDGRVARAPQQFRHVLYAGAARRDKGFSQVVDLIEHLNARNLRIPVVLQTSAEKDGKYDATIQADLQRLDRIAYPFLRIRPDTLDAAGYAELFNGAICLQLYDASVFRDRISGVTLDAFSSGCPVVSTSGSWIAKMVQRFDAGTIVDDTSPDQVLGALERQIAGYRNFNERARVAGEILQEENDAGILSRLLVGQDGDPPS